MTHQSTEIGRPMRRAANTTDWREEAVCATVDPELFFPAGISLEAVAQTEKAKQVCRTCPVRDLCLDWALKTRQGSGVWGGLDEWQRALIVRPAMSPMDWCRANQELIEKRRAAGVSWGKLALELGVRADNVRRAVAGFEAVRAAQAAQLDAASKAVSA